MLSQYERAKSRFCLLVGKLDALSPLNILSRGYSIAKSEEKGTIVKSVNDVEVGNNLEISLKDGKIYCEVKNKLSS
jgi:exodeoxyribonuclease VII large subunit